MKIKHIIITAGGTIESIDAVRQISNTSTGNLCSCIYGALAEYLTAKTINPEGNSGFMVHYVVSATSIRPEEKKGLPISFYTVTDVKSVESVLEKLLTEYKIDYVIHGMAVSDFTKGYLIERDTLTAELADALGKIPINDRESFSPENLKKLIGRIIENPAGKLDPSVKVSSQSELLLSLNKTPKLIKKIKELSPKTFLVGFKLLKGVTEEELVRVAARLSEKNGCDFIMANDLNSIQHGRHTGLLVKDGKVIERYDTKKEIAHGIAKHMLDDAKKRD